MGIIDHDERVVFLGEVTDLGEWREGSIHGEHPIGDDERAAGTLGGDELRLKVCHVSVLVAIAGGLAETDAVDDRGVIEFVGDDGIAVVEEDFEDASVCVEARREQDRCVGAKQARQSRFKFIVLGLRATDEANTCHPESVRVERLLGRGDDIGVVGQTEVVVGAKIQEVSVTAFNVRSLG